MSQPLPISVSPAALSAAATAVDALTERLRTAILAAGTALASPVLGDATWRADAATARVVDTTFDALSTITRGLEDTRSGLSAAEAAYAGSDQRAAALHRHHH